MRHRISLKPNKYSVLRTRTSWRALHLHSNAGPCSAHNPDRTRDPALHN